ncbi:MAG: dihydrolipoyllysine-residue acetyltransferase [Pseudomonadota bacterium]
MSQLFEKTLEKTIEIKVPDIGDYSDIPVIDVCVKVGDSVQIDDALLTLESDKATMDVPSSAAGVVKEIKVKVGDKVSQGSLVVLLAVSSENGAAATPAPVPSAAQSVPVAPAQPVAASAAPVTASPSVGASAALLEVKVPDIGDYADVPVIDICVKVGDSVQIDDALITLESDKATMDVPASVAGVVREIKVKLGDRVSQGQVILLIASGAPAAAVATPATVVSAVAPSLPSATSPVSAAATVATAVLSVAASPSPAALSVGGRSHASPSVRLFARELGVDLSKVSASGNKGRITREDISRFVKTALQTPISTAATAASGNAGGLDLLPWPKVDFAKFGPIEVKPLSRIKKISGANLARNWVMVPAVTYHEDADITELEAFRVATNKEYEKSGQAGGLKITMLAFLIKACASALKKFPEFNSSLDGDNLVLKQYCHIAFAADTPNGLVVPVIKNADQKSISEIALESSQLAKKARDGKLGPADMSGACFTISSLGGIGSTAFSPIVNAPEVAILGVSKSLMKPVWNGKDFVPRLILPMSLSADHRVIDGAMGARFNVYVAQLLADMRRVLL